MPEKKKQYELPLHRLLDRILEVGRNEHGMFYDVINPKAGTVLETRLADTWGYTLDGYYIVHLVDKTPAYREALLKVFSNLNTYYRNHNWEGNADGYADAIESAINLYYHEPSPQVLQWIESQIEVLWKYQQPDGVIEGWYGDGNFARTSIMYALMKTGGTHISPWRSDVLFGAVPTKKGLEIVIQSTENWSGKLLFDRLRHRENLHLPMDWPRINQFPEWFPVQGNTRYQVTDLTKRRSRIIDGRKLSDGYALALKKGEIIHLSIEPL
jgi:hypothetical protein